MARNSEKAQATLNRLIQAKKDAAMGVAEKRPYLADKCDNLQDAERWRRQIIGEVTREVASIQNGAMGEHRVRDLNDHINKLIREKKHWERQVKILGGPDHQSSAPRVTDGDGSIALGTSGYYYFGAARELPGVRELFEKQVAAKARKTRGELYKMVDADYYGYRDEDDGLLVKLEAQRTEAGLAQSVKEWRAEMKVLKRLRYKKLGIEDPEEEDEEEFVINTGEGENEAQLFKAHVPLPSQASIEKLVLEKKKKELLAKFAWLKKK